MSRTCWCNNNVCECQVDMTPATDVLRSAVLAALDGHMSIAWTAEELADRVMEQIDALRDPTCVHCGEDISSDKPWHHESDGWSDGSVWCDDGKTTVATPKSGGTA